MRVHSLCFALTRLIRSAFSARSVLCNSLKKREREGVGQEVPQEGVKVSDKPAPISHSQRAAADPPLARTPAVLGVNGGGAG